MTRSRISATGLALVAVVALVVSYIHLRRLCLDAGESVLVSALLPLSVDALLVSAGATMRVQADEGRRDPLVVVAFVLGCLATLAGNTYEGAHNGVLGALVAGWAPVAVFFAFEAWVRSAFAQADEGAHQCAHEDQLTLRERVESLLAEETNLTPREIAVRTGASESYARKLLGARVNGAEVTQ